jgi:outer membrane receptor protein involved in Fe transport
MHSQRLQLLFSLLLVAAAATAATAATAARTTAIAATATATTAAAALATKPLAPPGADSTCSRSKHVVLASFGEPDEYHTVSLYFASKFPNASVHHLWLYLGDKTEEEDDDDASDDDAKETTKKSTSTTSALLRNRATELKK